MEALLKYLGIAGGLIFVFLVVRNGQAASDVIQSLGNVNTGAIRALQGR